ncbi:DUF551 domain-containing protein [Bacteroides ovatus]|uniref:DUF551 domain-containing protein n=1 Tax=Bacteroides ovatus TaxID=28116 RepID=UPI00189BE857|nr:DUF551 domain-containing protein [Bacteroides ovatus]MDC2620828.1 DUF551 domain-containing protein [Bacteroides ovatus]MDC2747236.1 DUF551 domain-containing protein [Bacteroides ovatus]MDC2756881.1 DUF551 domain-containing protein [Bacteroides ovatus]
MKQTLEEAAYDYATNKTKFRKEVLKEVDPDNYVSRKSDYMEDFQCGAEWYAKQSPWISIEERLPDKGQRVLVGFLYYYKYDDREAESRKHIDVFTYENGIWTTDSDISYLGKSVEKDDIKVICWMPIPSFDEILETNRDVLERIKEKGD